MILCQQNTEYSSNIFGATSFSVLAKFFPLSMVCYWDGTQSTMTCQNTDMMFFLIFICHLPLPAILLLYHAHSILANV
jgi:hypothetical protein